MGTYISSNANRFYAALESSYGQAALATASNRFPAVRLSAKQVVEQARRRDKTGSRTFLGVPPNARRLTAFEVQTYLTSWSGVGLPAYGPLFQAALGGAHPSAGHDGGFRAASRRLVETASPHRLNRRMGSVTERRDPVCDGNSRPIEIVAECAVHIDACLGAAFAPRHVYALDGASECHTLRLLGPLDCGPKIVTGAAVDSFEVP